MAQIFPDPISPDTKSNAERELYDLFKEGLDNNFIVMHNVPWIGRDSGSGARDGEADFVIAHPNYGVLVIEVKGGEIHLNQRTQTWASVSSSGHEYEIKDPFQQARSSAYTLLDKLKDDASPTHHHYWPVHYAVAFPDVGLTSDLRLDAPREIIIGQTNLVDIQGTIKDIYDFWHGESKPPATPGPAGIDSLINLLAPSWHLRSKLSLAFEQERDQIKKLTERQFMALNLLSRHRRVVIVGGAGTGKTMLAIEKTRRMAQEGFEVLFVCYNHNLSDWLNEIIGDHENVLVTTFHGLCGKAIHWAGIPFPEGPRDQSFYDERLPDGLMEAVDNMDRRFDAIVVDEGQDFKRDEWWLAIESLLRDQENGIFYVFFDDNQRIYNKIENIPISEQPFVLDINCRNTQAVHQSLEPYSHALYKTTSNGPKGRAPEVIPADESEARDKVKHVLLRLVNEEGIEPRRIIILTPRSQDNSIWSEGDRLAIFSLTWNLETKLKQAIRVCTVYSYKGLESPVVILTEMDHAKSDQVIYVGLSRARNHVCVIGELPPPKGPEADIHEEGEENA